MEPTPVRGQPVTLDGSGRMVPWSAGVSIGYAMTACASGAMCPVARSGTQVPVLLDPSTSALVAAVGASVVPKANGSVTTGAPPPGVPWALMTTKAGSNQVGFADVGE